MPHDIEALWDFADPAGTEARLTGALASATGDEALVLRTQVARTWGLRRDAVRARRELELVAGALDTAGPEARTRYWLELGRTWISAVSRADERTGEALAAARDAYARALELAESAGLDALAIDAIHMMAFVDPEPEAQLDWNDRGLAIARASADPAARRWEAALRNNRGVALQEAGRHAEAVAELRRALALREAAGEVRPIRIGRWMVGWALRHAGRPDEALAMQLALERELDAAGEPDPDVFEELEVLYRDAGDEARAAHYAGRLAAARAGTANGG